jgi:hypothetical protein
VTAAVPLALALKVILVMSLSPVTPPNPILAIYILPPPPVLPKSNGKAEAPLMLTKSSKLVG